MSQPDFRQVEVGDIVVRLMAEVVEQKLKVDKVDDRLIYCYCTGPDDAWTFDRATGIEEDEDLGWGVQFGVTGSRLVSFKKKGA